MSIALIFVILLILVIVAVPIGVIIFLQNRQQNNRLKVQEIDQLQQIIGQVAAMGQRLDHIEALLDEDHPDWREHE